MLELPEASEFSFDNLPRKPYCTNDFQYGLLIRPQKKALEHNYIQLNPPCLQWALTFDLDYPGAAIVPETDKLPRPTYTVINPENKHAHIIYRLAAPICTTDAARMKPLRYAAAIENAFCKRLFADVNYSGLIAKNPWKTEKWEVWDNGNLAYDLDYLADALWLDKEKYEPLKRKWKPEPDIVGLGRNCSVFETVRLWSYSAIRENWRPEGAEKWTEAVFDKCIDVNTFFNVPLAFRELSSIARSIAKWTWRHFRPDELAAWHSRKGRKGMEIRWGIRKPEGIAMLIAGQGTKGIKAALNVCRKTVNRWRVSSGLSKEETRAKGMLLLTQGKDIPTIATEMKVTQRTVKNWQKLLFPKQKEVISKKEQGIELLKAGVEVKIIAEKLNINQSTVRRWRIALKPSK